MRRGVLIQSLISSESGERPGILEHVLSRARALVLTENLDRSFSRKGITEATFQGGFSVSGLPRAQIRAITGAIAARWKNAPEIVIVENMDDPAVPEAARLENALQLSGGASGTPRAFIAGNRIYIVASEMKNEKDVVEALLHESLGHFGLRGLYGAELNRILEQVAALRRSDVEAMAKRYGLDMENEADRLQAAEEVLVHLAQTKPESGFVQRAIAAIRKWLRENIPGFANMKLSDGEIIENYLVPARRFVEQGGVAAPQGGMIEAFSRTSGIHAINATVNRQIEQWATDKLPRNAVLQLGKPSEILRLFDVPDLPIRLSPYILTKARKKHELTATNLRDLALNVQTPIAVFKSTH